MANEDLLRELGDDIRREKLAALWRQFGRHVLGISLSVVLLTAGVVFWQQHQEKKYTAMTAALVKAQTALSQNREAEALALLEETGSPARGDFAGLARLRQAAALEKAGKMPEARAVYQALYGESGVGRPYRDMAGLRLALLEKEPAKALAVLEDIAGEGRPFRASALELQAMIYQAQGEPKKASAALTALLADESVPASIRARASALKGSVGAP